MYIIFYTVKNSPNTRIQVQDKRTAGVFKEEEGVELIACKMTVDMMEVDEEKLIEGVIVWTAEDFLKYAKECKICLFT